MLETVILALLTSGGHGQAAQAIRTPGDYAVSQNLAVNAKGPLLYLKNRPLQTEDNPAIEGGFTTFDCGTLHVVGPAQMTMIDPDYDQAPNVYDGLPRRLKVLYLASTFSQSQWQTACSSGIGLDDMNREQQGVYRSLLPSVFEYQTSPVYLPGAKSYNPNDTTQTTLTSAQESQVRMKFMKEMTLGVRLEGGGYSGASAQQSDRHKPGEKLSRRLDDHAAEDKNFSFGVQVRKTSPNKPKPSDLDYKSPAFDAPLSLSPSTTVKELCQSLSGLAHLTIVPDARFQNEQVIFQGTTARSGDVLKGLALCVTGTYRKVGNTYVLTSDLEGIGTKMTKLAFWHRNVNLIAEKNSEKWKAQISANPGVKSIGYAPGDPFVPNDAMRKFMETDFDQGDKTMPASELTPAALHVLNSKDLHYPAPLRTDVVEPWDEVFWCFVAPGDVTLQWDGELCDLNELTHYAERHPARGAGQEPEPLQLGGLPASALVWQTGDPEAAAQLPRVAKARGFTEIWLQTTNAKALSAASEASKGAGIKLSLVVEPFTAVGSQRKDQLDRSILGQTYSQAEALVDASAWVQDGNEIVSVSERTVDYLAENSTDLAAYWSTLAGLAKSPELSGVVVLSDNPTGYERQSGWPEYELPEIGAPMSLGYTTDLREKFLLANSVDPVDLLEVRYQFDLMPLEQSISSFGDLNNYTYGKVEDPGGYRDKWDKMRLEVNQEQLTKFESGFAMPLLVEWQRLLHDTANWDRAVSPLAGNPPAATMNTDVYTENIPVEAYYLQRVGYPISDGASRFLRTHMTIRMKNHLCRLAVDLRAVPPDQLEKLLKALFAP